MIDDADLVFLWASWAIFTNAADEDEENVDRQIIFGKITERVASAAVPVGSLADDLGERSLERVQRALIGGVFALEDGTTIHLERDVLADGRRLLLCRVDRPQADGVEGLLVSGGACQISEFPGSDPRIAKCQQPRDTSPSGRGQAPVANPLRYCRKCPIPNSGFPP